MAAFFELCPNDIKDQSFSRSMRSMRTMQCSERRSLDGRRTRWSRRSRRGGRPWTSAKWMTVRVQSHLDWPGQWQVTSGTSTPSGTTVHLWGSGSLREGLPQGKGKGQVLQSFDKGQGKGFAKGSDKGKARVSTRVKARALGGTRATGTKERAITAARWGTSAPSAGSIGRTIRTRFAPWTRRTRRLSNRWSVRRAGWWVRWTKLYPPPEASWSRPRKVACRSNPARLLKYGPPGLGLRSTHGYGCSDVCHYPFKVLDQEDGFRHR